MYRFRNEEIFKFTKRNYIYILLHYISFFSSHVALIAAKRLFPTLNIFIYKLYHKFYRL